MSSSEEYGLKEDWSSIEETLKRVIPIYDKTNKYISFGTHVRIRKTGIEFLRSKMGEVSDFSVIDLGTGPGKMAELLGSNCVLFDALIPMMKVSLNRNPSSQGIIGVYENIPLRNDCVRGAMAGFAIRDARNLSVALQEVARILSRGGYFLVVDLSKPDSRVKKFLTGLYWRTLAPLIAFFAAGRLGLTFAGLSTTFQRLPTNSEFMRLAREAGLDLIESKYFLLDGACAILLQKTNLESQSRIA